MAHGKEIGEGVAAVRFYCIVCATSPKLRLEPHASSWRARFSSLRPIPAADSHVTWDGPAFPAQDVAVKLEETKAAHPQLHYESRVYRHLSGGEGIPNIRSGSLLPCDVWLFFAWLPPSCHLCKAATSWLWSRDAVGVQLAKTKSIASLCFVLPSRWYGIEGEFNVLVMDLLGPRSVGNLYCAVGGRDWVAREREGSAMQRAGAGKEYQRNRLTRPAFLELKMDYANYSKPTKWHSRHSTCADEICVLCM